MTGGVAFMENPTATLDLRSNFPAHLHNQILCDHSKLRSLSLRFSTPWLAPKSPWGACFSYDQIVRRSLLALGHGCTNRARRVRSRVVLFSNREECKI